MKSIILTLIFLSASVFGQFKSADNYLEPIVGFSFLGSTPQYGFNYEHTFLVEREHKIGIGFVARYWKYSEQFVATKTSYVDFLVGVQTNYHFYLRNKRVNPWIGIVAGYDFGSAKTSWTSEVHPEVVLESPEYGGLMFSVHAGLRYWLSPNIALSTRIGFGTMSYGALDLGVIFRI
ncbi:MAG: hypothetical protein V3V16_01840 [Melioribacteraceae bacterium]